MLMTPLLGENKIAMFDEIRNIAKNKNCMVHKKPQHPNQSKPHCFALVQFLF